MDIRALIMGLAFAFMWSSAFTSARIIVLDAPPLLALSLRFMLSGLLAVGIARVLGQSWSLSRRQWWAIAIFGVCQNALYLGLNFVAMQTIEASLAAIIASTMPLWVALAGWAVFGETLGKASVFGLVAGFAGVLLIMGGRLDGSVDPFGLALCFGGVLALTIATLSLSSASKGGDFLMIVGLQMLVGSVALASVGFALEEPVFNISPTWLWAFAYTTLVPGLAATLTWFFLVNRIGAVRAATFHFLNPFLGVAVAAMILSEQLRLLDLIGVCVIAAGILVVQRSKIQSKLN